MEDIVGQETIVEILNNAIKKEKIGHAYLFTGPRGTGKTSTAKVFARAVNCTSTTHVMCGTCENCTAHPHPDIVEIDAASNNGVDEIRSLIERVKYSPILGSYKVYIIDEVHMLTQSAFNALLKTLEEPPAHVIFILATTEIHKVLPTIISRCQRFDFMRISNDAIMSLLSRVIEKEGYQAQPEALRAIAQLAQGGMRNALTMLEQAMVLADHEITLEQIQKTHGLLNQEQTITIFNAIHEGDARILNQQIQNIMKHSVHIDHVLLNLTYHIKDSVIYTATHDASLVPQEWLEVIEMLDQLWSLSKRQEIMQHCVDVLNQLRNANDPRLYFEMGLLGLLEFKDHATQTKQVVQETKHPENKKEDTTSHYEAEDIIDFEVFEAPVETAPQKEPKKSKHKKLETEDVAAVEEAFLLQLMASGSKEIRMMDERAMASIDTYLSDALFARISSYLRQASVVISNDWFIVLNIPNALQVKELHKHDNHELMHRFIAALLGDQREVYVVHQASFEQAVMTFKSLLDAKELPNALEKPQTFTYTFEVEKKDTPLERIKSLFGDQVEVKV